ncbi:hypothetical protein G6F24_018960 [Rhizopus arrhizus]|nr:hypothetical protein G6F24_018960 [Rhizopus arrhizus]
MLKLCSPHSGGKAMSPLASRRPSPLSPWQAAHWAAYSAWPRIGSGVSVLSIGPSLGAATRAPSGTGLLSHAM